MLTATQCEIVAYYIPEHGEFICRECAAKATSQLTVEKADEGLVGDRLQPIIRYELDEYASSNLWEYLSEEYEGAELEAAYNAAECQEPCGDCGTDLL
jgi:hypothetical protein